ncbi:MAG: ATP-binding cassette domain-containing protein [Thermodesulfobacteriota bacterium]
MTMINVQGLVKEFDGFRAVDNLSFAVNKGEIVALLGPNGAGKTTTLRVLTGYLAPTSGDVEVKGLRLNEKPEEVKQAIGYLPESAPLYKNMLVYDYLLFLAGIRRLDPGRRHSRIKEIVQNCGLTEIMHKPISELSKGLRQRVGLAHALLHDPEILILDEPSEGLDPNQIQEIRAMIKRIGREKTVILSTHILSEAEATCDRMVVINKGGIVADGTSGQLRADSKNQGRVRLLLKDAPRKESLDRVSALKGVRRVEQEEAGPNLLQFELSCEPGRDIREDLYLSVKETEWTLLELHQQSQSLENIFQELTKEN